MKRIDDSYEEDRYGNDMMAVASHCSRFSRRHDFDMFNMSTYQSCENCRHLSATDQCVVNAQTRIFPLE